MDSELAARKQLAEVADIVESGAGEDQDALPSMIQPRREADPVGPDVDVVRGREIMALPALMLLPPVGD